MFFCHLTHIIHGINKVYHSGICVKSNNARAAGSSIEPRSTILR